VGTSPREQPRTVGVLIVEPIRIVRSSLRMVFEAEPGMEVVGDASTIEDGIELVRGLSRHTRIVALVGLEFVGEADSFALIRTVRAEFPSIIVLATGTDFNQRAVSRALFMGADGFIHKNSEPQRFVEAARRSAAGELVLEGLPRGALGEIVEGMDAQRNVPSVLTEREKSVLAAAGEGLTAREIARRLGMAERTVTTHLNHIYRKLGVSGRVAALSVAVQMGIIRGPDVVSIDAAAGVAAISASSILAG
jgi:two-component system, NarL family, response regulator DevR